MTDDVILGNEANFCLYDMTELRMTDERIQSNDEGDAYIGHICL